MRGDEAGRDPPGDHFAELQAGPVLADDVRADHVLEDEAEVTKFGSGLLLRQCKCATTNICPVDRDRPLAPRGVRRDDGRDFNPEVRSEQLPLLGRREGAGAQTRPASNFPRPADVWGINSNWACYCSAYPYFP